MSATRHLQVGRQPAARQLLGLPQERRRQLHRLPQGRHAGPGEGRHHDRGPAGDHRRPEPDVALHQQPARPDDDRGRHAPVGRLPRARARPPTGAPSPSSTGSTTRCASRPAPCSSSPPSPTRRRPRRHPRWPAGDHHRAPSRSTAARSPRDRRLARERPRRGPPGDARHVHARPSATRSATSWATPGIEIGKGVEISTASPARDEPAVLIDGEVTSIEADYDTLGARAIVRGYDRSHRLAAGRKTDDLPGDELLRDREQDRPATRARRRGRRLRGVPRARPPGERVRPRLPLRPGAPDRLRLPGRRHDARCSRRPVESDTGPGRGRLHERERRCSSCGTRTSSSSGRA